MKDLFWQILFDKWGISFDIVFKKMAYKPFALDTYDANEF